MAFTAWYEHPETHKLVNTDYFAPDIRLPVRRPDMLSFTATSANAVTRPVFEIVTLARWDFRGGIHVYAERLPTAVRVAARVRIERPRS